MKPGGRRPSRRKKSAKKGGVPVGQAAIKRAKEAAVSKALQALEGLNCLNLVDSFEDTVDSFLQELVDFFRDGQADRKSEAFLQSTAKNLGVDFDWCLRMLHAGKEDPVVLHEFHRKLWRECLINAKGETARRLTANVETRRESKYWVASFTNAKGQRIEISTGIPNREREYLKALRVAEQFEVASRFEEHFAEQDSEDGMSPADWLNGQKEFEKETGKKPLAVTGEYFAWYQERRKKADEERSKPLVVAKARKIARSDPDITAPTPDRDEIPEILQFFRSCWVKQNGEIDRESWPTKMDVCVKIGWGRARVEGLLRGGRHPHRNVWRGGSTGKGGAAPNRVTPEGCRRVMRIFLKEEGWDSNASREFLEDLARVRF